METVYQQIDALFEHGLLNSGISIALGAILLFIMNHILNKVFKKKFQDPLKRIVPMRIKKIMMMILLFALIMSEVSATQSIMKALLASGGILAVIIGFASQEAASNLMSGVMIMSYKPFQIGDWVSVKEYNVMGKVIDISLRQSVIETLERTQIMVPNTIMNKAIIENISNVNTQKANYLYIDISYESDIDQAIAIIQQEGEQHPLCIDGRSKEQIERHEPMVKVHCVEFKDSGIQLRATLLSKDNGDGFQLLSDLRIRIKHRFDEEGIVIPYPHCVVVEK